MSTAAGHVVAEPGDGRALGEDRLLRAALQAHLVLELAGDGLMGQRGRQRVAAAHEIGSVCHASVVG